jgi:hypothetical protein
LIHKHSTLTIVEGKPKDQNIKPTKSEASNQVPLDSKDNTGTIIDSSDTQKVENPQVSCILMVGVSALINLSISTFKIPVLTSWWRM